MSRTLLVSLTTVFGYFFLLVNAYYGGALTMFFTTKSPLPFENINGLFALIPPWKLLFRFQLSKTRLRVFVKRTSFILEPEWSPTLRCAPPCSQTTPAS